MKDGGEDQVVRTERESDRRRDKKWQELVLPRPAKSVQNGAALMEKLEYAVGLLKRKEWPQCHRESSWPGTPPLPKRKGAKPSVQSTRS